MSEFKLPFRGFGLAGPWGVGKTLACLDFLVMAKKAGGAEEEITDKIPTTFKSKNRPFIIPP